MADAAGKKFVNDPSTVVLDSLKGLCALNPDLELLEEHKVLYHRPITTTYLDSQVHLISGGGSGHEPSHAGLVGDGMLSAAVCGDVFASPSSQAVLEAIKKCGGKKGVLLVVKNYTGDRLQFSLALSQARALGIETDMVIVGDDAAIGQGEKEFAGRRGLAGTVLIHKIVGSWARKGTPLSALARLASQLSTQLLTLSASLTPISLPGRSATFSIPEDSYELGLGIHGEPGASTVRFEGSKEVVDRIVDGLVGEGSSGRGYREVKEGDKIAVLINNLGGVSGLEMGVVVKDVVEALRSRGLAPSRLYSAPLMTSLDMRGVSVTLLRLPRAEDPKPDILNGGISEEWESLWTESGVLEALDDYVGVTAWPERGGAPVTRTVPSEEVPAKGAEERCSGTGGDTSKGKEKAETETKGGYKEAPKLRTLLKTACEALIAATAELNTLDSHSGDGDTGTTLSSGARALLDADAAGTLRYDDPAECFAEIQRVLATSMGGTMGALIGVWVGAVAEFLRQGKERTREEGEDLWDNLNGKAWAESVQIATKALSTVSGAKYGGRTLLDSLSPFASTLVFSGDVDVAARSAKMGARATEDIEHATHGRASYVGRSLKGHMDPGAVAVWRITEAIAAQTERWYEEERQAKMGMGGGGPGNMRQQFGGAFGSGVITMGGGGGRGDKKIMFG
ncbi:Dak1-domain-containing protein [Gonapodya prolifera JEL478]|uniref:Dak1-domain-containing protein n=1 Tax=Gonapodya prolifera (strain JEL478) TaxID=1344416 RepID=A0A139AXA8_GONPJ|nr:Dak1-domain-containing protein [Gonapodya prolifera JEL478]|eukprot:KXS21213.1 Dak1-domain-containing protein [Gonapodya prolifera JEL478]